MLPSPAHPDTGAPPGLGSLHHLALAGTRRRLFGRPLRGPQAPGGEPLPRSVRLLASEGANRKETALGLATRAGLWGDFELGKACESLRRQLSIRLEPLFSAPKTAGAVSIHAPHVIFPEDEVSPIQVDHFRRVLTKQGQVLHRQAKPELARDANANPSRY